MLRFKTDDALPPALAAAARVTGRVVQLPAQDAADIERILSGLRAAGVGVHDVEIRKADLEDVFLSLMAEGRYPDPAREPAPADEPAETPEGGVRL